MARTQIPVTVLTANAVTADVAGTAVDPTNGMYIDVSAYRSEKLIIRVKNTTASTKTVTVEEGSNPPADAAGEGTVVVSLTDGSGTPTVAFIGPLTSARFIQKGSLIFVDPQASMTGAITAFVIPRAA